MTPPPSAGWQAPTQAWEAQSAPVAPPAPPFAATPSQAAPSATPYGTPPPPQAAPAYPGAAQPPFTPAYQQPPLAATPVATKKSSGGKFGAFIGLIGGALAIVGSFLAWVKVSPGNDVAYTVTGWNLSNDAKITLAIGAVAVVLAVIVIGGSMRGFVRLLFVLGGIGLIGLASYDTYDILKKLPDRLADAFPDGGAKINGPGIGLILVYAGGALLILGALAMKKRKATV